MERIARIQQLVGILNEARDAYYNIDESSMSDQQYDKLFDELSILEKETGYILSISPTQSVGYEVKSALNKVKHNHPMLSLDKTKSVDDLVSFLEGHIGVMMLKLDGLTVSLRYVGGELVSAETRGNGEIGEDILHNAKTFKGVPLHIDYDGELIVDGEAIITYDNFNRINRHLPEGEKYKNPRNLASGSVRQLDSSIAAKRSVMFVAWKLVKGSSLNSFRDRLVSLQHYGFTVVPFLSVYGNKMAMLSAIDRLKLDAETMSVPIDGMVLGFDDVAYGDSLGMTGHHVRSQIAFKFSDEMVETTLLGVDWTMGKTGVLTPTAVFEPVEIDGTMVERASVHNVSILESLELSIGDTITVYKANQIIPQVAENLSAKERRNSPHVGQMDAFVSIPAKCPICGSGTIIKRENESSVLMCANSLCSGMLLGKLNHFVSKNAMNIDGLSEATLKKFIDLEWVSSFIDLYYLYLREDEMQSLDGFGEKSTQKLLEAIENSKHTTLDRFIYSLSIPLIGRSASKTISRAFKGNIIPFISALKNGYDWSSLDDFGQEMSRSMTEFGFSQTSWLEELSQEMEFEMPEAPTGYTADLSGKTFVITGGLNSFVNRDEAKNLIEALGGKVAGSVSKKTAYLINNDITSKSTKNKKAKELGIPILTEKEFLSILRSE